MAKRREIEFADPSVRWRAGKASDYVSPFKIEPGDKVIVVARVSRRQQKHNENLANQATNLSDEVESNGGIVAAEITHVGNGSDPSWLARAVHLARQRGAVALLAETTDRLIRHPGFHTKLDKDAQARKCDLEWLSYWANGIELMTHLHPDASPHDVRSYQRKRGHAAKSRGGRPKKNHANRPCEYQSRPTDSDFYILESQLKKGQSIRVIARLFGRSPSTIQGWIRQLNQRSSSVCTNY